MDKGERLPFGPVDQARALINNKDAALFPHDRSVFLQRHVEALKRILGKPQLSDSDILRIRQTLWWHRNVLERMGYDVGEYPFTTNDAGGQSDGELGI